MEIIEANFENWYIQCIPEDGGRISVLKYAGHDLLTQNPPVFKPPERFYGEYETRPVYGYDDCFPSVDPCIYPEEQLECRDHGQLCWQEWKVQTKGNNLICSTDCLNPEVTFKRMLEFTGNKLTWRFEVVNVSAKKLVFLHVMHALLPVKKIQSIKIPEFGKIVDEIKSVDLGLKRAHELADNLLAIQHGAYEMLLVKEISEGSVKLGFKNGLNLHISFDIKLFPTIGIWWNNAGYPEEEGLQRTECAFEPIPGTCSDLSRSFRDGIYLMAESGKTLAWEINWTIEHDDIIN
jgi:hypothetical protein